MTQPSAARYRNPDSKETLCSISRIHAFLQPVINSVLYGEAQVSLLTAESHNNCQSQSSLNCIREHYVHSSQVFISSYKYILIAVYRLTCTKPTQISTFTTSKT